MMDGMLYDVRQDAFAKSRDVEQGERLFRLMHYADILQGTARKEGGLALWETVEEIPLETGLYQDMKYGILLYVDGWDLEDILEILTARYWRKNLQGEDALLYYMIILSVARIWIGTSPYHLERLLVACLSDEAAEKYAEYKKQHQHQYLKHGYEYTPMEILMDSEPSFGAKGISVVKELLEKRIEHADEKVLRRVIHDVKDSDLTGALKGLSISDKRKIFSVIPDRKAEEYAEDCEYMGPLREIDLMEYMSEVITVFEKLAKNTEGTDDKE